MLSKLYFCNLLENEQRNKLDIVTLLPLFPIRYRNFIGSNQL